MGKKKHEKHHSVWSVSYYRDVCNLAFLPITSGFRNKGFTLIETIVVAGILVVVASIMFVLFNPLEQIKKAYDYKRQKDLSQIHLALDNYYDDKNCFPASSSNFESKLALGSLWKEDDVTYMSKIPQDISCSNNLSDCYTYRTDDNAACPQWFVLFGKLAVPPRDTTASCPLSASCLPANYAESGFNLCSYSGSIDCNVLAESVLPTGVNKPTPTAAPDTPTPAPPTNTPVPTNTPTLTSTPTPTSVLPPTSTPTLTPTPTIPVCPDGYFTCGCGVNNVKQCNSTSELIPGNTYYCTNTCNNQCQLQSC